MVAPAIARGGGAPGPAGSATRRTGGPSAPSCRKRTDPSGPRDAAIVIGAVGRPSLSMTVSTSSAVQQRITGGAKRRDPGAITKPPSPVGESDPGAMAAMLVRTETDGSGVPVKRVEARLSGTRNVSAR